jgi:hypothetical protein
LREFERAKEPRLYSELFRGLQASPASPNGFCYYKIESSIQPLSAHSVQPILASQKFPRFDARPLNGASERLLSALFSERLVLRIRVDENGSLWVFKMKYNQ